MSNKAKERGQILRVAFERAKAQNEKFSLRALAQKLEISAGFLSKILNGKMDLPKNRVNTFIKVLKIDTLLAQQLWETYQEEGLPDWLDKKERSIDLTTAKELPEKFHSLLAYWYYLALLDLSQCKGFVAEPEWIAKRLRITKAQAGNALEYLKVSGHLVERNGAWTKQEEFTRLPAIESKQTIRSFHEQMLTKAIQHMKNNVSPEAFQKRLISGFMVPTNPKNLEKAKMRMHQAMMEVVAILGEGEKTELYYFADLLFPLTGE